MDPTGKPRDLVPKQRQAPNLSQSRPADLTAERAEKVLRSNRRESAETSQDPVSRKGGLFETLSYVVVLAGVIGFQLLSGLGEGDRSLTADPLVVGATIEDRQRDRTLEIDGARLAFPDCPDGAPVIEITGHSKEGFSLGDVTVSTEPADGYWRFGAEGLLAGGARVHVEAAIDCQSGAPGSEEGETTP